MSQEKTRHVNGFRYSDPIIITDEIWVQKSNNILKFLTSRNIVYPYTECKKNKEADRADKPVIHASLSFYV